MHYAKLTKSKGVDQRQGPLSPRRVDTIEVDNEIRSFSNQARSKILGTKSCSSLGNSQETRILHQHGRILVQLFATLQNLE